MRCDAGPLTMARSPERAGLLMMSLAGNGVGPYNFALATAASTRGLSAAAGPPVGLTGPTGLAAHHRHHQLLTRGLPAFEDAK